MKNILTLSLIVLFLSISTNAYAMQCVPKKFDEIVQQSDLVFTGKVIKRDAFNEDVDSFCWKYSSDNPSCGSKVAVFEINKVWKGDVQKSTVSVYSGDACYCVGSYFNLGEEYIVFANKNSSKLPFSAEYSIGTVCDGTTSMLNHEYANELEQKLDRQLKNQQP